MLYESIVTFRFSAFISKAAAISSIDSPSVVNPILIYPSIADRLSLTESSKNKYAVSFSCSSIASDTTSLVPISLVNLLPSLFTIIAPLPLTASVIIYPFVGTTVGWVWISSICVVAAPILVAITIPSPVAPGWFVVPNPANSLLSSVTISELAEKPPVAIITALASIVMMFPSLSLAVIPFTILSSYKISVASVLSKISIFSFSIFSFNTSTIWGPTGAPPVGRWDLLLVEPPNLPTSLKSAPILINHSTALGASVVNVLTSSGSFFSYPPFMVSS